MSTIVSTVSECFLGGRGGASLVCHPWLTGLLVSGCWHDLLGKPTILTCGTCVRSETRCGEMYHYRLCYGFSPILDRQTDRQTGNTQHACERQCSRGPNGPGSRCDAIRPLASLLALPYLPPCLAFHLPWLIMSHSSIYVYWMN